MYSACSFTDDCHSHLTLSTSNAEKEPSSSTKAIHKPKRQKIGRGRKGILPALMQNLMNFQAERCQLNVKGTEFWVNFFHSEKEEGTHTDSDSKVSNRGYLFTHESSEESSEVSLRTATVLCNSVTVLSYSGEGIYTVSQVMGDKGSADNVDRGLSTSNTNAQFACSVSVGLHINIPSCTCSHMVEYGASSTRVHTRQGPRLELIQRYWTAKPEKFHMETIK